MRHRTQDRKLDRSRTTRAVDIVEERTDARVVYDEIQGIRSNCRTGRRLELIGCDPCSRRKLRKDIVIELQLVYTVHQFKIRNRSRPGHVRSPNGLQSSDSAAAVFIDCIKSSRHLPTRNSRESIFLINIYLYTRRIYERSTNKHGDFGPNRGGLDLPGMHYTSCRADNRKSRRVRYHYDT